MLLHKSCNREFDQIASFGDFRHRVRHDFTLGFGQTDPAFDHREPDRSHHAVKQVEHGRTTARRQGPPAQQLAKNVAAGCVTRRGEKMERGEDGMDRRSCRPRSTAPGTEGAIQHDGKRGYAKGSMQGYVVPVAAGAKDTILPERSGCRRSSI